MSLCARHYIEAFRRRVGDALIRALRASRVRPPRVLFAVSGGKDSVALLDVLAWLSERQGFEVIGATIDLGIPGFSDHALRTAIEAFNAVGVEYVVIDARLAVGVDTACAEHAWRAGATRRPTCATCGFIKRRLLEETARSLGADAIATGHTASDVLQFNLANLASGQQRRFAIVEVGEFVRLKPLAVVSEVDTLNYVRARNLPFTTTPCPYKPRGGTPARIYAELLAEASPGASKLLKSINLYTKLPRIPRRCIYCGAPSEGEICAACRTFSAISPLCLP